MPITTTTNSPTSDALSSDEVERNWQNAMLRGAQRCCPACGDGAMFDGFLKVNDACPSCGTELHHHRADDAPPYFTMFIVGHVLVGAMLSLEQSFKPPTWVHVALWMPLTIILSAMLLPRIKGALIALQWALRMHGFAGETPPSDRVEEPPKAWRDEATR